jgi:hypothetical protein
MSKAEIERINNELDEAARLATQATVHISYDGLDVATEKMKKAARHILVAQGLLRSHMNRDQGPKR